MSLLGNAVLAMVVGVSALATALLIMFIAMLACVQIARSVRESTTMQLVKFVAGLAVCGIVGATIMQVCGLWIT